MNTRLLGSSLVIGTVMLCCAGCEVVQLPSATAEEEARTINAVFESPQAYTIRHLQAVELDSFLLSHPEHAVDSIAMRAFYRRRNWQYAWFINDSLSSAAGNFLNLVAANDSVLQRAFSHDALHELVQRIDDRQDSMPLTATFIRHLELSLTAQFFRFADRKYSGLVQRDLRELDWFIPRRKKDLSQLLDSLVAGRMDLSPIEPLHPQYLALKRQLPALYGLRWMDALPRTDLGTRRKLEPGDRDSTVVLIRERLTALGDLTWYDLSAAKDAVLYDSTLLAAVKVFQSRHGLLPDGVIGKGFMAQLNTKVADRIRTVLVNMERLRWVPERTAPDMLLVNIPEFRLHVHEGGRTIWSMDVVVGAEATSTVVFTDSLSRIVFSPTWSVPTSIVRNEILPAMRRDPGYLARKGMKRVGGSDALPRIVQEPGPGNALGRVKFLFPNSYSIYLHDTPSKGAFARENRALSHGCVRLSDPTRLAAYLLRNDTSWTTERIKTAMDRNNELGVPIRPRLPVVIGYFTAWVDEDGRLNFRDDIYGHDARLARELFDDTRPSDVPTVTGVLPEAGP